MAQRMFNNRKIALKLIVRPQSSLGANGRRVRRRRRSNCSNNSTNRL